MAKVVRTSTFDDIYLSVKTETIDSKEQVIESTQFSFHKNPCGGYDVCIYNPKKETLAFWLSKEEAKQIMAVLLTD